jgi:hypothetical protein
MQRAQAAVRPMRFDNYFLDDLGQFGLGSRALSFVPLRPISLALARG